MLLHRSTLIIYITACMLIACSRLCAAEDDPRIESCRSPFGFNIPNRAWSPVITRIDNPGDTDRELLVSITFSMGPKDSVNYMRKIWVPAFGKRTVETFVLMDYPPRSISSLFDENDKKIKFSDGTTLTTLRRKTKDKFFFDVNLADAESGTQYPRQKWNAFLVHPEAKFLLIADGLKTPDAFHESYTYHGLPYVLGEHGNDNAFITGAEPPASEVFSEQNEPLADEIGTTVHRSMVRLEHLPRKWAAYEGVDTVILGSLGQFAGISGLSPQQRHSLLRYVRSGGRLVIIPAYDPRAYQHPFWQELLPVRITGTRLLDDGLSCLEEQYGRKVTYDRERPPVMVEALPGKGEILARDGARVLLARREVGTGEVWFLAITGTAMQDWSRAHSLWARILHSRPNPAPGLYHGFSANAANFLAGVVGAKAPQPTLISCLLAGYFILAMAALVVCRWRGRQELGWPIVVVLSVCGLAAASFISSTSRSKVGFVQGEVGVTVLRPGMPQGGTTSFIGIFSPNKTMLDLAWLSPDTLATGYANWGQGASGGNLGQNLQALESNRFTFPGIQLNPGEMKVCRAMTMSRFGKGIDLQFGYSASGIKGYVHNRTGRSLRHCILRINRRTLRIGELPRDARKNLEDLDFSWSLADSDFATSDEDKVRRYILAEVLRMNIGMGFYGKRRFSWPIAFYGWSDKPQARLKLGNSKPRERALQLVVAEVARINHSGRVRVPAGACGLRLLRGGNRMAYGNAMRRPAMDNVRLPTRGILIAGTKRKRHRQRKPRTRRPGMRTPMDEVARAQPRKASDQERHRPMGWIPGINPTRIRVGFDRPQGLENMITRKLTLLIDVRTRGFLSRVRIRKPGTARFSKIPGLEISGNLLRKVFRGRSLQRYLGPGGELPEFELQFMPPAGQAMTTSGTWEVKVFDVELEGEMGRKKSKSKKSKNKNQNENIT